MTGRGLAAAFEELRPALRRYLRSRGGGEDIDDLLQELWLRADASRPEHVAEPQAYLYRMAHNLMLDRLREGRRRLDREEAFQEAQLGRWQPPTAERQLLARERLATIEAALAALGPRTDMIFRRHRLDRTPQQALAGEFGITLSAIEKHLQKAYKAVAAAQRRYLEERSVESDGAEPGDGR